MSSVFKERAIEGDIVLGRMGLAYRVSVLRIHRRNTGYTFHLRGQGILILQRALPLESFKHNEKLLKGTKIRAT